MKKWHAGFGAALASLLVLSACTGNNNKNNNVSPSPTQGQTTASPTASGSNGATGATGANFENWGSYGYTLTNNRHVPFKEISADNIKDLGVIWSADLKTLDADVKNGNQSYPVVVDGVIYLTTSGNQVFALDAVTGKTIWHWKPSAEQAANFSKAGIIANRGVAVGEGKVFMLAVDNSLISLDQKTGALVKMVKLSDYIDGVTLENGYYETTAPQYYKGNVYFGSSGGDNGIRGFVTALIIIGEAAAS